MEGEIGDVGPYKVFGFLAGLTKSGALLFGGEMNWNWAYIRNHISTLFSMIEWSERKVDISKLPSNYCDQGNKKKNA